MTKWEEIEPTKEPILRFAELADPLEDSLNDKIFRALFEKNGTCAEFVSLRVSEEEFEKCVRHLAKSGFKGALVGNPNKSAAARLAEQFYQVKHSLGIATALTFEEEHIYGMNLEIPAFLAPIQDVPSGTALVVGAGQGGRVVAMALVLKGWRVRLWNRSALKARAVVNALRAFLRTQPEYSSRKLVEILPEPDPTGCSLIVNATSLGKKIGEQPPVLWQNCMRNVIAYDLVYRNVRTEFLRSAYDRGFRIIDGREMLVEHSALAWEWWTNSPAPRDVMREAAGL